MVITSTMGQFAMSSNHHHSFIPTNRILVIYTAIKLVNVMTIVMEFLAVKTKIALA